MKKVAMLETAGRRFVARAGVHATRTGRQRRLADEHATDRQSGYSNATVRQLELETCKAERPVDL
jgi:hypothetical protein